VVQKSLSYIVMKGFFIGGGEYFFYHQRFYSHYSLQTSLRLAFYYNRAAIEKSFIYQFYKIKAVTKSIYPKQKTFITESFLFIFNHIFGFSNFLYQSF